MPLPKRTRMPQLERAGRAATRAASLARLIGPLERMEDYLVGREPADRFKRGFTDEWGRLEFGSAGQDIGDVITGLERYYEQLHYFSAEPERSAAGSNLF